MNTEIKTPPAPSARAPHGREQRTEVLIVGAGPVGLLSALLLAEAGVQVTIVDREERTAARSYGCALHPAALEVLDRAGLAAALVERGLKIGRVAFYEGEQRRADAEVSDKGSRFPFVLVLPQSELESLIEQRLHTKYKVAILWNHRFDSLRSEDGEIESTLERLGGTGTGYIVPHWETVVMKRLPIRSRFLVGTDGYNSTVRQRLGIQMEPLAKPQSFAVVQFTTDTQAEREMRVVLDETTANVLWPMPGGGFRWTFQLTRSEVPAGFPEKARDTFRFTAAEMQDQMRRWAQNVIKRRAPWFRASVQEITWCTQVPFAPALAKQFGQGRCWLAGDAAHQAIPIGVQSLNRGLLEAEALAAALQTVLREGKQPDQLDQYNRQCQAQWRNLLDLERGLAPTHDCSPWARQRAARIGPCLPACGDELLHMAGQLGLTAEKELATAGAAAA